MSSYDEGVRIEQGACQTGVTCFIDWVKDYRVVYRGEYTEDNWHTQDLNEVLDSPDFLAYLAHVQKVRGKYALPTTSIFANSWFKVQNGQLKWAFVSFNSTLDIELMPLEEITPQYNDWETWLNNNLSTLRGFQTCSMWSWMSTQEEILRSVFTSIGACLAITWLILILATSNWIVASMCLACITVILMVFALFITIVGWSLGIFEAVGLIVVVGLSVDYTVHICHSFNECRFVAGRKASRAERTTHALMEMGVSVVSGAATTFLASLFLLPTSFTFFFYFGIFMLVTVVVSLSVALTLLPALLYTWGPEDGRGDLDVIRRVGASLYMCCWREPRISSKEVPRPSSRTEATD